MSGTETLPRILISNDDGVAAPGLLALVDELRNFRCEFSVCGPSGERSAQSHSITVGKHLHAFNIPVQGADEAYAVDGSPADSVMLALHSPLLRNPNFDLVVSGINRGDNCGLHVIYSGTVGAAREAACKDIPSLAFSLDNHQARAQEQYQIAARYAVAVIKATLGYFPEPIGRPIREDLKGAVLNVNIPGFMDASSILGFQLCSQGFHCSLPEFREVEADPHFGQSKDDRNSHAHKLIMGEVNLRAFRNGAGYLREDRRPGTDSWSVTNGWIAVNPVGLISGLPLTLKEASDRFNPTVLSAAKAILTSAAAELGVKVETIEIQG